MTGDEGRERQRRTGRGRRRVTVPGTSGQSEAAESQPWVPLTAEAVLPARETDERAEALKRERPPHWG
ncbi:hypothetical protein [Nesterenkonia sp. NBAIMH1]|uniref:hypothetical protein n=1 Tax=Nesterenkonia sp. NBAIMH1 TaxID=2600320 RepID=UPI0011B6E4BE|nr:hypothetical protein [Nesterenkonia sp. NBAIMH1]